MRISLKSTLSSPPVLSQFNCRIKACRHHREKKMMLMGGAGSPQETQEATLTFPGVLQVCHLSIENQV